MSESKNESRPTDVPEENLTIEAVSRALGVPASTLHSWEWRYQLPTGRHRKEGQRRYTSDDIATLTRIRDETAAGRGTTEAAALVAARMTASPAQVVDRLLAATHRLDTQSIYETLQQSRHTHGLVVTLEQVILPALREIGQQWADGTSDVAHEHLLAGAVQSWMSAQQHQADPPNRAGAVVLACGPEDQHTLALEALTVLLADRGVLCRYLGAQTPISSLVLAAERPPARAAVVVAHLGQSRAAAVSALRAVAALPVATFYAGGAFTQPEQRQNVPGTYLGRSLSAAAQCIAAAVD